MTLRVEKMYQDILGKIENLGQNIGVRTKKNAFLLYSLVAVGIAVLVFGGVVLARAIGKGFKK